MSGQNIGYIRVSTADQKTDRQLDGVDLHEVFEDKASAKDTKRPALRECIKYIRKGDTLHVHSIDRLARNLIDLQQLVEQVTVKGAQIRFHKEGLTFSGGDDAMSKLILQVMGAFSEFERTLILERQREGIAKAKAKGKKWGRAPKLTPEQIEEIRERIAQGEEKKALATEFGISRQGLYKAIKKSEEML